MVWYDPAVSYALGGLSRLTGQNYPIALYQRLMDSLLAIGGNTGRRPSVRRDWAEGAQLASATTITLGTDGNSFDITGTTQTTSITAVSSGTVVYLTAVSAGWRLTNGSNLKLKGGYDFWSEVGSVIQLHCYDGVNWRELSRVHPTEASSSNLGSDVTMTNAGQWYDGPTMSLPAGTWDVSGHAFFDVPSQMYCVARLFDGTNVLDADETAVTAATLYQSTSVGAIVTLTATTTVKLQGWGQTTAGATLKGNTPHGSTSKGTSIKAHRIA